MPVFGHMAMSAAEAIREADAVVRDTEADRKLEDEERRRQKYPMPSRYVVMGKAGIIVRAACDISSNELCRYPEGEVLAAVELSGRRAHIVAPIDGWVSVESEKGKALVRCATVEEEEEEVSRCEPRLDSVIMMNIPTDIDKFSFCPEYR